MAISYYLPRVGPSSRSGPDVQIDTPRGWSVFPEGRLASVEIRRSEFVFEPKEGEGSKAAETLHIPETPQSVSGWMLLGKDNETGQFALMGVSGRAGGAAEAWLQNHTVIRGHYRTEDDVHVRGLDPIDAPLAWIAAVREMGRVEPIFFGSGLASRKTKETLEVLGGYEISAQDVFVPVKIDAKERPRPADVPVRDGRFGYIVSAHHKASNVRVLVLYEHETFSGPNGGEMAKPI